MAVEIAFPLEFCVSGTPVSLQVKRTESKLAWKERIRRASQCVLPEDHFATDARLAVTMCYFPAIKMQGDLDNIIKPVLDALSRHVYLDDRQVERILIRKFEPGRIAEFRNPSARFLEAMTSPPPFLYVRLDTDLEEGVL